MRGGRNLWVPHSRQPCVRAILGTTDSPRPRVDGEVRRATSPSIARGGAVRCGRTRVAASDCVGKGGSILSVHGPNRLVGAALRQVDIHARNRIRVGVLVVTECTTAGD